MSAADRTVTNQSPLVSLADIALTFPQMPRPLVERPYLLEAIESTFRTNCDVVLIEGEEEIGKTILLAQFALRYIEKCFSVFIRPVNDLAFDPRQIRYDLCNQINWFLRGTTIPSDAEMAPADLSNLLLALQRARITKGHPYYFVIDGLADIPSAASGVRELILRALPIGLDGFRVVLSGSSTALGVQSIRGLRASTFRMVPFGLHETDQLFAGLDIPSATLRVVRDTCRGIPGHLSTVKRTMLSGCSVEEVLDLLPQAAAEIFEKEWRITSQLSRDELVVVSCIALLSQHQTPAALARLLDNSEDRVRSVIERLPFLQLSENRDSVTFISEGFRKFALMKLAHLEREVWDLAIRRLLESPDSDRSIVALPAYLERSGNVAGLVKYLTVTRIAQAVRAMESTPNALKFLDRAGSAMGVAGMKDYATKLKIFRSAIADLKDCSIYVARAEAALVVGDESLALTLANAAPTEEQRLRLLVIVAKYRANMRSDDPALIDQIRNLVGRIDFTELDELSVHVASELISISPELAGDVLRSYARGSNDPNALDRAFSSMTITALRRNKRSDTSSVLSQVDRLAASEQFRGLEASAALAWATDRGDQLLKELSRLSTTSEKVFLGRWWVRSHAKREDAIKVALELCSRILADTAYVPSATTFRDLAVPLLYAARCEDSLRLLSMLEGQSEVTRRSGPLVDHYRLRFMLFRARGSLREPQDWNVLLGEAFEIEKIPDASSKATCAAWMLRTLDHTGDREGLRAYVEDELEDSLNRLLNQTAEHDEAVRPVIRALAQPYFERALDVAAKLNTVERRDEALLTILAELTRAKGGNATADLDRMSRISQVLGRVVQWDSRQLAVRQAANWLASRETKVVNAKYALDILDEWLVSIQDLDESCLVQSKILGSEKFIEVAGYDSSQRFRMLIEAWGSIDDRWVRLHCGYICVHHLSKGAREVQHARELFDRIESEDATEVDALRAAQTISALLLLAGRAFAGLTRNKLTSDGDMERLAQIASAIPGSVERARLMSLVSGYVSRHNVDICRAIIQKHVRPVIAENLIGSQCASDIRILLVQAAPLLWLSHPSSALDYIRRLDSEAREEAIVNIVRYILVGQLPADSWIAPVHRQVKVLGEEEIADALELMRGLDRDWTTAGCLETITNALKDRKVTARINPNQKAHFISRMAGLSQEKFPDPSGVQHDGYLIYSDAILHSVKNASKPEWELLFKRVESIQNRSDSCFLALMCVELIPSKWSDLSQSFFRLGTNLLRELPTYEDRMMRTISLIQYCSNTYPVATRKIVEEMLGSAGCEADASNNERRERVIEMAHRIDEEWAASLVSTTDDDPVRSSMRHLAKKKQIELRIRKDLSSSEWEFEKGVDAEDLARACWMELGVLNATGVTARSVAEAHSLIELAGAGALGDCYPTIAFATETIVRRYAVTAQAVDYLRPLFDSFSEAADMVRQVAVGDSWSRAATKDILRREIGAASIVDTVVGPGQRERAIVEVKRWLMEVKPPELTIVDPYFGPADLDALVIVQAIVPDCQVRVLTSLKNQPKLGDDRDYSQIYGEAWRRNVSLSPPPESLVCIAGTVTDGSLPIHDRWWACEESALDFGTSWNSLGHLKTSVIRSVRGRHAMARLEELAPFFRMKSRGSDGTKYKYVIFTLET